MAPPVCAGCAMWMVQWGQLNGGSCNDTGESKGVRGQQPPLGVRKGAPVSYTHLRAHETSAHL
eukprot:6874990-Alexandrium_andersonii.AAC.1